MTALLLVAAVATGYTSIFSHGATGLPGAVGGALSALLVWVALTD